MTGLPLEVAPCTSACQAQVPIGWLPWLFLELKSYGTWYRDRPDKLLFEILGATLPLDILIYDHGDNTPMPLHNLREEQDASRLLTFLAGNERPGRWTHCPAKDHAIKRFPRPTGPGNRLHLYHFRISTENSFRRVVLGVFSVGHPAEVICQGCLNRIESFLKAPEAAPCQVAASGARVRQFDQLLSKMDFDEKGDALSRLVTASMGWFHNLLDSRSRVLPRSHQAELGELAQSLAGHAFSLSVAFNYRVLLNEPGFGYFLTPSQERQIELRIKSSRRERSLVKRFLQGQSFSTGATKGLVHYVTDPSRCHALWARDVFAEAIYNGEGIEELGRLEDRVVHQPSEGATSNFIFEAPIYGHRGTERASEIVAVFFLVLARRYSSPVGGILLLAARLAIQQLLLGIDAALGERARDEHIRSRYNPLLIRPHVEHGFLQKLFPRTGGRTPFHNIEDFFTASRDELIKRVTAMRDLPEFHLLREHGDTAAITRTVDNSTESCDDGELRWALTCLKTRVRVVEVGNEYQPYLLDLFHYLCGWHWSESENGKT